MQAAASAAAASAARLAAEAPGGRSHERAALALLDAVLLELRRGQGQAAAAEGHGEAAVVAASPPYGCWCETVARLRDGVAECVVEVGKASRIRAVATTM